jgi:hypothetical protein
LIRDKDRDLFRDKDRIRLEIELSCNSVLYKESNIFRKAAFGSTKPGCSLFLELSIADLTGDINMRKSTTGKMFFLGNCLVSSQSLKQWIVAVIM